MASSSSAAPVERKNLAFHLKLHGIRHPANQFESATKQMRRSSSVTTSKEMAAARRDSMIQHSHEWIRRHSLTVAIKNTDWAHYFLSTGASENAISAFLTFKDPTDRDAEYYFNFIPKAVANQSDTYKELLAVYNSLACWGRQQQLFRGKKVLLSVHHPEALLLLRKAKLSSKRVSPAIVMILSEISEMCRQLNCEYRLGDLDTQITIQDTAPYLLLRLDQPECKKRMKALVNQMTIDKGERFVVKERMFPPSYVA